MGRRRSNELERAFFSHLIETEALLLQREMLMKGVTITILFSSKTTDICSPWDSNPENHHWLTSEQDILVPLNLYARSEISAKCGVSLHPRAHTKWL